ncbi:hypothetical protein DFH27DRAFT_476267 [Peziza echinospora]|nr:hypothetical protein DFH27DRAFT_476267 [Peziza echinospora]
MSSRPQPHHGSPPSSSHSSASSASSHGHAVRPQSISQADLQFLRQTQRTLGLSPAGSTATSSTSHVSASSSTTAGLSLDSNALTALSNHFDGLMSAITTRVQNLSEQTRVSTQATHKRSTQAVDRATIEIETLRDILRQCDELETEFLKIKRLGEMVKGFRKRVEGLEKRVGR